MKNGFVLAMALAIATLANPSLADWEAGYASGQYSGPNQGVNTLIKTHPEENAGAMGWYVGETQPICWPGFYGPIKMDLPARQEIIYVSTEYDDWAIQVGYATIGISMANGTGPAVRVFQELEKNGLDANFRDVELSETANGLSQAVSTSFGFGEEQVSVGACQWGSVVVTVTVYGHGADRVKLILNSIQPPTAS